MPSPEQILNGLAKAANEFYLVSIFWHLLAILLIFMLFAGRNLSTRQVMLFVTLPVLSVALVAWFIANPFNGIVFSALTVILGWTALISPVEKVSFKWDLVSVAGLLLVVFGLIYPHFLEEEGYLHYLYKAPVGLIPCPTLSMVIGFTLMLKGFQNRKWMWYLSCVGLFYGIFGVFRLGVHIDVVLIAGALTLFIFALSFRKIEEIS